MVREEGEIYVAVPEHFSFRGPTLTFLQGEEFDETKTVAFPFYRNVGIHHSLLFEIDLWAYTQGREGGDGPPFQDAGKRALSLVHPISY